MIVSLNISGETLQCHISIISYYYHISIKLDNILLNVCVGEKVSVSKIIYCYLASLKLMN